MHENNKKWLDDISKDYPECFKGKRILEVGSKDWNGSARAWFVYAKEYYGIDKENGRFVDNTISLKDFKRDEPFDVVVSLSVLEHDFEWKESLHNLLNLTKPGTMLFMCWGAEGNREHNPPWEPVPHQDVIDYLKELGFEVLDSFFEEDRYGADCAGCYDVVARRK